MTHNFHVYVDGKYVQSFLTRRLALKATYENRWIGARIKHKDVWLSEMEQPYVVQEVAKPKVFAGTTLELVNQPFMFAEPSSLLMGVVFVPTHEHCYSVAATGDKVWNRFCLVVVTSGFGPPVGEQFPIDVTTLVIPVTLQRA